MGANNSLKFDKDEFYQAFDILTFDIWHERLNQILATTWYKIIQDGSNVYFKLANTKIKFWRNLYLIIEMPRWLIKNM